MLEHRGAHFEVGADVLATRGEHVQVGKEFRTAAGLGRRPRPQAKTELAHAN